MTKTRNGHQRRSVSVTILKIESNFHVASRWVSHGVKRRTKIVFCSERWSYGMNFSLGLLQSKRYQNLRYTVKKILRIETFPIWKFAATRGISSASLFHQSCAKIHWRPMIASVCSKSPAASKWLVTPVLNPTIRIQTEGYMNNGQMGCRLRTDEGGVTHKLTRVRTHTHTHKHTRMRTHTVTHAQANNCFKWTFMFRIHQKSQWIMFRIIISL